MKYILKIYTGKRIFLSTNCIIEMNYLITIGKGGKKKVIEPDCTRYEIRH